MKYKQLKIAFLGNQDNVSIMLQMCLDDAGIESELFLLESELFNARSSLPQMGIDINEKRFTLLSDCKSEYISLSRNTKKTLEKYNLIFVSGNSANQIVAQTKCDNVVYLPVGANELTKYLKRIGILRKLKSSFKDASNSAGLTNKIVNFLYPLVYPKRLQQFQQKVDFIATRHFSGRKMQEFSEIGDKAFPKSTPVGWPEFMPKFEFIRQNYNRPLANKLNNKYSNYEIVLLAPSRKWIVPDLKTGYTKSTDWILKALDYLSENQVLNPTKHRVIWLDHGPDSQYCKQYIQNSEWSRYVDFYPHQSSKDLWSIFSLKNVIILDEFNDNHWGSLGGAIRESLAFHCPIFGRNFDTSKEPFKSIYMSLPFNYCETQNDLNTELKTFLLEGGENVTKFAKQIALWEKNINPSQIFLDGLLKILDLSLEKLQVNKTP